MNERIDVDNIWRIGRVRRWSLFAVGLIGSVWVVLYSAFGCASLFLGWPLIGIALGFGGAGEEVGEVGWVVQVFPGMCLMFLPLLLVGIGSRAQTLPRTGALVCVGGFYYAIGVFSMGVVFPLFLDFSGALVSVFGFFYTVFDWPFAASWSVIAIGLPAAAGAAFLAIGGAAVRPDGQPFVEWRTRLSVDGDRSEIWRRLSREAINVSPERGEPVAVSIVSGTPLESNALWALSYRTFSIGQYRPSFYIRIKESVPGDFFVYRTFRPSLLATDFEVRVTNGELEIVHRKSAAQQIFMPEDFLRTASVLKRESMFWQDWLREGRNDSAVT